MNTIIIICTTKFMRMNTSMGYFVGVIITLIIPGYLVFTIIKPERF
ncbi:MAG: hypothetical protein LLG13_14755 [Bacteroidales bacterium]|nr:hypothetical protein [Bacteroidales bacterium]